MNESREAVPKERFVAAQWLRQAAGDFVAWSRVSGEAQRRASTLGEAIARVAHPSWHSSAPGAVGQSLLGALRNCDALSFSHMPEAIAYAGLHLLDRYGRVMQVLEYLMQIGRLPLRKVGIKVLEVGSGPAPALYATHDFYSMLRDWPHRGSTQIAGVEGAHSLERGEAWGPLLHHVSEHLMIVREGSEEFSGLPFGRSIEDFSGFDTLQRHHDAIAQHAQRIFNDFDLADEPISRQTASSMAYQDGGGLPSAYDLVFMCNFLTQSSMTQQFRKELQRLASALTPGGVLVVMGATGKQYPEIYENVREIASAARLIDISPSDVFNANLGPHLRLVREHTRAHVATALADCSFEERHEICSNLPKDLWNPDIEFVLPKYQVLVFIRQSRPRINALSPRVASSKCQINDR